jgi:biotin transport system permease protein/energy-coupling factor transport system permease protein
MREPVFFRYKGGTSFLHRLPAIIKILLLIPLAIIIMRVNSTVSLLCIVVFTLTALMCGWTIKEICTDIRPALFYGIFLYELNILGNVIDGLKQNTITLAILIPNYAYRVYLIKLLALLQISALLFRTSTSIAIKDALCSVERAIRLYIKKYIAKQIALTTKFADNIALTLNFIPDIFEQFSKIDLAYRARGGKNGIQKIKIILPALLSLSLHRASIKAKAIAAREGPAGADGSPGGGGAGRNGPVSFTGAKMCA